MERGCGADFEIYMALANSSQVWLWQLEREAFLVETKTDYST